MKVYPLKVSFDSFSIFFAWSACTWWLFSSVNFVWGLRTPNCVSLVERKEKSRSLINKYDLSYTNIYVVFILGSIEDRISNSVHKDTTFLILYLIFSCVQKAERKHHPLKHQYQQLFTKNMSCNNTNFGCLQNEGFSNCSSTKRRWF